MASNFLRNRAAEVLRRSINLPHQLSFSTKLLNSINARGMHFTPCLSKVVSFNLSDIGEGIREVVVKEWFVKEGDTVEQFENLCEVQSDKASVTITSRYDGKVVKLYHKVDDVALVGKPLVDIDMEEDKEEDGSESSSSSSSESDDDKPIITKEQGVAGMSEAGDRLITLATPAVRRIAMENKVDLAKVTATGRNGRVLKGDVLEFLGKVPVGTNVPHPTIVARTSITKATVPDRTEPLKGVRRAMWKTMTESLKIPHFAYSDEVDMTKLMQFRDQLNVVAQEHGISKLTFMPFCIKAASIALLKYPILNSSLDETNETIVYKGGHNISVAIDTPQGLVVPNIKNCERKTIMEIAKDLNTLIEKGRMGGLSPLDFAEGTFSLSNIGVIGGTYTHPCIMAPQVSIGAMGRTKAVPRFNDKDEVVKAYIMNVSWSADHRVIDGVAMASFSNLWKKYLENPALFLLH